MTATPEEVLERLADREHERWAKWQAYLYSKCIRNDDGSLTIPAALVVRWQSQLDTPYTYLTEPEKESDRLEVRENLRAARDLGWRLVPWRETPEMLAAAIGWREYDRREGLSGAADMFDRVWHAMLATAPDLLEDK